MRIIIPIAGSVNFADSDLIYPKPLIDINDKPIIEYVIDNFLEIKEDISFCFILKQSLCSEFNLDYTLNQLTSNSIIINLKKETKGATCSVLMAIDKISMDEEIIIVNYDQYISRTGSSRNKVAQDDDKVNRHCKAFRLKQSRRSKAIF